MSVYFKNKFRDSQNKKKMVNTLLLKAMINKNNKKSYLLKKKDYKPNVIPILEESKKPDILSASSSGDSILVQNKFIQTGESIIINKNFIELTL